MKTEFEMRNGELYVIRHISADQVTPQLWRSLPPADQQAMARDRAEWEAAEAAKKKHHSHKEKAHGAV